MPHATKIIFKKDQSERFPCILDIIKPMQRTLN